MRVWLVHRQSQPLDELHEPRSTAWKQSFQPHEGPEKAVTEGRRREVAAARMRDFMMEFFGIDLKVYY